MLGEHHEIENEFPDFHQRLEELVASDTEFAAMVKKHDLLDKEIRELEERGQPLTDESMEAMKLKRAGLKDSIYTRLRASS